MHESARGTEGVVPFDVVICGGGLAGLLLARQIRQEFPRQSVAIVERDKRPLPDACHKVGESSVELASQYMERLGLKDYLLERQLVKFSLRFFPGGGDRPLAERTELGPFTDPIVRSYQLDRGRLEEDLRGFNEADGVTLFEGAKVKDIALGTNGARHVVDFELDGQRRQVSARWIVDAAGRSALIRRQLKLTRGSPHAASAGWFRIAGRLDINSLVPATEVEWHKRPGSKERWRSTNHLMGPGYWVWIIPLSTGMTSIGVVVHDELHAFHDVSSLAGVRRWLEKHEPVMARALEHADVKDFLCLKGYSHCVSRCWSPDRWAIVGEAGAFIDPLYSPGSDFIALANNFTVEMMRTDLAGGDMQAKADLLNTQYRTMVSGTIEVFRQAAPVYGNARAMASKIYWDNFVYWSFTCQYAQQEIYRLEPAAHAPFRDVGRRFMDTHLRMQTFLRTWAELAPPIHDPTFRSLPAFPSLLVDAHIAVASKMTPDETLAYMTMRAAQGEEIIGELVLRAVQELGPELGRQLLERARFDTWNVPISGDRLRNETSDSLTRRRQLSPIARDVERNLGKVFRHAEANRARDLLAQGSAA